MRKLLNPRWIFIINTIPTLVLFFLCFGQYQIIKSLLEDNSILLWKIFGSILAFLFLLSLGFAIFFEIKKIKVPLWFGIATLIFYITFLYFYSIYLQRIIPFSIPRWMVSDNIYFYVGTFIMPSLIYAILILVVYFTPEEKEHAAWKSFVAAILIPVFAYIINWIVLPARKIFNSEFGSLVLVVLFIIGTILFLFFLIRSVYILVISKNIRWKKYQLIWKIPISVIFPLIGLLLNNGKLFTYNLDGSYIFGNFGNEWFYILAVLNGLFICLPNLTNKIYRLVLFISRCITFTFTFYFFLVFLPFLPLSVVAIIVFGLGFLMLSPLILFVVHIQELAEDFRFIKQNFSVKITYILAVLSFLVIPIFLTSNYCKDRSVLVDALEYVYNPDYSKKYAINTESLRKTMDVVTMHKKGMNRDFDLFGNNTPYLSSLYNWIVFDNMTLPNSKHFRIENVFFNSDFQDNDFFDSRRDSVCITDIKKECRYDKKQNSWISKVELELKNRNTNSRIAEYISNFELPQGCYLSDYYLYIGDKKESGILAEKKTATWVFQQITTTNRDPGIVFYLNSNWVSMRVFPFSQGEVRKTGFELIHKEPVKITIDSSLIELGNRSEQTNISFAENQEKSVIYIPASEKQKLPLVQKEPYYHFLVDISKDKEKYISDYISEIDSLLKSGPIDSRGAKISFVGTYTTSCSVQDDWKSILKSQSFGGGFFLDRAIKSTIIENYKSKSEFYPLMIVISKHQFNSILDNDYNDYCHFYPERNTFYELSDEGKLLSHSLISDSKRAFVDSVKQDFKVKVRAYPNEKNPVAFLPDDNKASIVLRKDCVDINPEQILEKNWQSALGMYGKYLSQILHPENEEKDWLNMIKSSFTSKVMNPYTSYIVVENEAQKAVLKKKQEQVLAGNKNMALSDDLNRMSEPGLFILLLFAGLFFYIRNSKKIKSL